jgi:phage terminase large subunit
LLECLKRYRRAINQSTMEPGVPLHDEFSHGADMFRYAGMCVEQMKNDENTTKLSYPFMGHR